MHHDDRERPASFRGAEATHGISGEHIGDGSRDGKDERHGYDRWTGPERGRQGFPGSTEDRFGADAYNHDHIVGQGFEPRELARQDQDRHELGRQEYEWRGYSSMDERSGERINEDVGDIRSHGLGIVASDGDEARSGEVDDPTPASEGDPSQAGASGSDTGKVEVTGDESGSPHETPSARDATSGSTPIGHTYEGAGMMGTGGVDSMTWTGADGGPQRTGTGGGIGGGAAGSGVMNPGADVGGMPFGMATGSDLGSLGTSGQRGTGDISAGRTGDLGGIVGAAGSDAMGVGTGGGGQVGASSAVGTDPETVGDTDEGGMLSGGSGAVGTDGGAGARSTASTSGDSGRAAGSTGTSS